MNGFYVALAAAAFLVFAGLVGAKAVDLFGRDRHDRGRGAPGVLEISRRGGMGVDVQTGGISVKGEIGGREGGASVDIGTGAGADTGEAQTSPVGAPGGSGEPVPGRQPPAAVGGFAIDPERFSDMSPADTARLRGLCRQILEQPAYSRRDFVSLCQFVLDHLVRP